MRGSKTDVPVFLNVVNDAGVGNKTTKADFPRESASFLNYSTIATVVSSARDGWPAL